MKLLQTELPGVVAIQLDRYADSRGSFLESWHQQKYAALGLPVDFVQDNVSYSTKGVLRGLHYQNPNPQGKLLQVLEGEVFDVAVDIRVGVPTFGKWFGMNLSSENNTQLFIPAGFAHGFLVLSDFAIFSYKCTEFYNKNSERTIRWDDPTIGIDWPVKNPILSEKDRGGAFLKNLPTDQLLISDTKTK